MRFSLIALILFYSQIFSQSTVYVKYKSIEIAQKVYESKIPKLNKQNNSLDNFYDPIITSLNNDFGSLNSDLNKILKYEFNNSENLLDFINELQSNPNIEYFHQTSSYYIDDIPSDSLFSLQWGLKSINAMVAWDLIPTNSEQILLAVIDTGIDYLHPDLDDNIFKNKGEIGLDQFGNDKSSNGIDDDDNGFVDDFQGWDFVDKLDIYPAEMKDDFTLWDNNPMDEHGHGTNVSGILAGEHNDIGIAGANPKIKILNLRAFDKNGTGEEDDAASAIIYAVKMGAKIINMSWGDSQYSNLLKDVINYAYENGVILVGSSGNNSTNSPHYPSGFSNVISVGSIQESGSRSSFSNFGSSLDLVAPGSQIITTDLNGSYRMVNGTSASAPFVSAAAALLKSVNSFSNEEIKQILKSTASDLGENGWDEFYGAGNLDMGKALKILSPSSIKFNSPTQDYYTYEDSLIINITCLSPYFKNFELYYGIGTNPLAWENIFTGKESFQVYNEIITKIDILDFSDTTYTLRLLMNRIDGKTQEERINFGIDRTPPNILVQNISSVMLNDIETVQASIQSDDLSSVKLYYRRQNSEEEFNSIFLDGFNSEINTISDKHFGMLPNKEVLSGLDHEFYFHLTNQSGLTTEVLDGNEYFKISNSKVNSKIFPEKKAYSLPNGRIYRDPISLSNDGENYIFLNENKTSADLSIYKLELGTFVKLVDLKNKIPISINDFNNDGKKDILNLFVKNGYIDSQSGNGSLSFENKFTDTTQTFWPSYADDIDKDGKYEIITFSSDTTLTIWEVDPNFNLTLETVLSLSFARTSNMEIFRDNKVLVDNFDSDPNLEIVSIDNYGRLVIYEITGVDNYSNEKMVEYFLPTPLQSTIAKGDYDGDGSMDIGIVLIFEENIFLTPLTYCSVININDNQINYLFQNMFISTESNYIGRFDKQYHSIDFTDINNNGKEDLILFNFPNSYIFEFNENLTNQLFYQSNVNSQSIFVGDLDNNGVTEIGIPSGDKIYFNEFEDDDLVPPPVVNDFYSIDSTHVYFSWASNHFPVYIFKSIDNNIFKLFDSTFNSYFTDSVIAGQQTYYSLEYYDINSKVPLSARSNSIKIFPHAPGKIADIRVLSINNIEISFSLPLDKNQIRNNSFLVNDHFPSSFAIKNPNQIIINLNMDLLVGTNKIIIKNIRDIYNTPISDTILTFTSELQTKTDKSLHITNYEIINNYNLVVTFSSKLDTLTALNINNYELRPHNILLDLDFYKSDPNSIILTTQKPFGSIGKEYILKVKNVFSSFESGNLPISEFSGSEIVLSSTAQNLDNIYVYPNPIKREVHTILTFANLPPKVDIYIYSIDGEFIRMIKEEDGNGGVDWNLLDKNNKIIGSGIYFYKAISIDNNNKKIQEKIGKFAVTN